MPDRSIDDVVNDLSQIVDWCWQHNSRLGYFPAMYRKVTLRIKGGIANGQFEDGDRLERLDIVFAKRYIDAFNEYHQGIRPTQAWDYAFQAAGRSEPMIMQHLLLGMNAHINLDLGIAAAEICLGQDMASLRSDFFEVNQVLAGLLDEVQDGMNVSSPFYLAIDRLGWKADEAIGIFSLRQARRHAWHRARLLHKSPAEKVPAIIETIDRKVTILAKLICPPYNPVNAIARVVSASETPEPRQIIEELF
jgi:hypothetical protein